MIVLAEVLNVYSFSITAYGDTTTYRELSLERAAEVLAGWIEIGWRIDAVVFEIEGE